jgi:TonB family protein
MQDRVADVLTERAALDSGAVAGLFGSIVLHGSLAAVVVYAAFHQPAAQPAPALKIQFARMPAPAVASTPKRVTPRIEEPKPEPVKPAPVAAPPEKKTVPISPFGKSTKKGSENPETKPAIPQPAAAIEPAAGQSGVTALEGEPFPYTLYIDLMQTAIGRHWFRPQTGGAPKTIIHFIIQRDGTIRDASIELPSGNGTFDRAALRAVLEASPLRPLPFDYGGTYLGVHLTFR